MISDANTAATGSDAGSAVNVIKYTAADTTRRVALVGLFASILAIAAGYGAAFRHEGAPAWAAWLLALGIPVAIGAIMVLGAARGRGGIGSLKFPIGFVVAVLVVGFGAALALPATEGPLSALWLGLPTRAAIVIYGVGLLPIIVLPVSYALTFKTQTLNAEDVERVRALGRANAETTPLRVDTPDRSVSIGKDPHV